MTESKTRSTTLSVAAYLAAIDDETRRRDCEALVALMQRATGCAPRMWGASIVGFDSYHYRYESGREGDACVVGFSSRKGDISVYLPGGHDGAAALLASLGKHKTGKACLYIQRLSEVELSVLEALVAHAVTQTRQRYPRTGP